MTYINLLTNGTLNKYLTDIDRQAQEHFETLVMQMKDVQGITEQLKVNNPMERLERRHFIRHQAEDIILSELIYR